MLNISEVRCTKSTNTILSKFGKARAMHWSVIYGAMYFPCMMAFVFL